MFRARLNGLLERLAPAVEREGGYFTGQRVVFGRVLARDLFAAISLTHEVLAAHHGLAEMRRLIAVACAGEPLSVCFGKSERLLAPELAAALGRELTSRSGRRVLSTRVVIQDGDGCGAIFPDSRRRQLKRYCDRCRAGETGRQIAFEATQKSLRVGLKDGRLTRYQTMIRTDKGESLRVWAGRCACGNEFFDTAPNATVCTDCRRAKRTMRK